VVSTVINLIIVNAGCFRASRDDGMVPNGALGRRRVMSEGMMMLGHAVKQSVAALNGVKLKHLTDMSGSDFRPVPTLVSAADLARTRTPDSRTLQ
jgi:hypothetical protein